MYIIENKETKQQLFMSNKLAAVFDFIKIKGRDVPDTFKSLRYNLKQLGYLPIKNSIYRIIYIKDYNSKKTKLLLIKHLKSKCKPFYLIVCRRVNRYIKLYFKKELKNFSDIKQLLKSSYTVDEINSLYIKLHNSNVIHLNNYKKNYRLKYSVSYAIISREQTTYDPLSIDGYLRYINIKDILNA